MNIEIGIRPDSTSERRNVEGPLNVLLIGNFSGHGQLSDPATIARDKVNMSIVEPGGLDDTVSVIAPVLRLEGATLEIPFRSMDDFHPDRLMAGLPLYEDVQALKLALKNPASAERAMTVCRDLLGLVPESTALRQDDAKSEPPAATDNEDNLMSRLLGRPVTPSGSTDPRVHATVQKLLEQVGSEGAAPDEAPGVDSLLHQLDGLLAAALRDLLHNPDFQALEACWRSADWYLQNLDIDDELSVWLVDVGANTAEAWTAAVADRVGRTLDKVAQIVVLEEFSDTPASLAGLDAVSGLAARLKASAYAAADRTLAGVSLVPASGLALDATDIANEQSGTWRQARAGAHASRVILGFPRLLLRQPYGPKSDPVDRFEFEELPSAPEHESFLWGNPGPAIALMELRQTDRIYDLPMVVYDDGSGQAIKPPCEAYLTDSAAERILSRGIVPLIAHRGQTAAQVLQIAPIAG